MEVVGEISPVSEDILRRMPMMAWADKEHFQKRCGSMARDFMNALPQDWKDERLVFYNRRERLEKGWYPNFNYYHIDGLPHVAETIDQYRSPALKTEQIICCMGNISLTAFVIGDVELPEVNPGMRPFDVWNKIIAQRIQSGELKEVLVPANTLVRYGYGSFHRCTAATRSGYRYFIQVCRNSGVPFKNCEDIQFRLELQPVFRAENIWPQDTKADLEENSL
jgi:hypothetical protein